MLSHVAGAEVLSKLNCFSAAGPDGLHPSSLRGCSDALSWPLYFHVKSLEKGLLSSLWK